MFERVHGRARFPFRGTRPGEIGYRRHFLYPFLFKVGEVCARFEVSRGWWETRKM